jgi:hypothetical protein
MMKNRNEYWAAIPTYTIVNTVDDYSIPTAQQQNAVLAATNLFKTNLQQVVANPIVNTVDDYSIPTAQQQNAAIAAANMFKTDLQKINDIPLKPYTNTWGAIPKNPVAAVNSALQAGRLPMDPDDPIGFERFAEQCWWGQSNPGVDELPFGGEYQISGEWHHCPYEGPGTEDEGHKPKYKRVSYKADETTCCSNPGSKMIGGLTCNPNYRKGGESSDCGPILQNKCTGQMLENNDPNCTNWCKTNPNLCNTTINSYCKGVNMGKTWCKEKLIEIGGADNEVNNWCSTHIDDPFCSCYKAVKDSENVTDPDLQILLAAPECSVPKCSTVGYHYTNMRKILKSGCPDVCVNKISNNNYGEGNIYAKDIDQKCIKTINEPVVPKLPAAEPTPKLPAAEPTPKLPAAEPTPKLPASDKSKENPTNYFLIILVIIIAFVLGYTAIADTKKSQKSKV